MDLIKAHGLEAIQIDEHVILTGDVNLEADGQIPFIETRTAPDGSPAITFRAKNLPVRRDGDSVGLTIFKQMRVPRQISGLRIYDRAGERELAVTQAPGGITGSSGTAFHLPLIDSSATPEQAINAMHSADTRAVAVDYGGQKLKLFMNYDIADADVHDLNLTGIEDRGHPIANGLGPSGGRVQLFTLSGPSAPGTVFLTSLYETIGGPIISGVKICRCSGDSKHTVIDKTPTLDGQRCSSHPYDNGTYRCF
jgi:hypothetical protein